MPPASRREWGDGFLSGSDYILVEGGEVVFEGGAATLEYRVTASGAERRLWFSVDGRYAGAFAAGRCDGVVVMLLPYALARGLDIRSGLPLSKRLAFQLEKEVIPYASALGLNAFSIDLRSDACRYSKWLLPNLETEGCVLYEANGALNRVEKTAKVAAYAPSHDSLLVCWTGLGKNCGHCLKCERTLATLDLLGKVDLYASSFDLDDWYAHREEYLANVVNRRCKGLVCRDIYRYMRDNGIPLPSPQARLANYWTRDWRKLGRIARGEA